MNSLDHYSLINIANHLDLHSLYNLSRTSKTFKDICQNINHLKIWKKEVHDIFIDLLFDSVDISHQSRMATNMFLMESVLNVIQYSNEIHHNLVRGFTKCKHSDEVINYILKLSNVLLNVNYKYKSVFCFRSVDKDDHDKDSWVESSSDEESDDMNEKFEFICKGYDFSKVVHLDCWTNKQIWNCYYFKIPKHTNKENVKMLHKDIAYQEFCNEVQKMTNPFKISEAAKATAVQVIFGYDDETCYRENTPLRFIEEKELALLINRLQDIRNLNMKHILSSNQLPTKLVAYLMCLSTFVSVQDFTEVIDYCVNFAKCFFHDFDCLFRCGDVFNSRVETFLSELMMNKEYTKYLFKSAYIDKKKLQRNDFIIYDHVLRCWKFKHILMGLYDQVEIFFWEGNERDCCYLVNGAKVDSEFVDTEEVGKITKTINGFLLKNLATPDSKTQPNITHKFTMLFLTMLFKVSKPYTDSYDSNYHVTVINLDSIMPTP